MKTEEIVANWLPRYTKRNGGFWKYILLTNFNKYVEIFTRKVQCSHSR